MFSSSKIHVHVPDGRLFPHENYRHLDQWESWAFSVFLGRYGIKEDWDPEREYLHAIQVLNALAETDCRSSGETGYYQGLYGALRGEAPTANRYGPADDRLTNSRLREFV